MEHRLNHPFTEKQIRKLKLGDTVYVSGEIIFSAGLPTYQRLVEYVEQKEELPIDMKNAALFHLGANSRETNGNYEVLYVNPTTSARFNPYMPTLVKNLQLRLIGGKGGLDSNSVIALKEVGCVYLAFLGGGAPIYSKAMKNVPSVHWTDMVPHYRLTQIEANELGPLIVAIDAHGNSLYEQIQTGLSRKFPEIVKAFETKGE